MTDVVSAGAVASSRLDRRLDRVDSPSRLTQLVRFAAISAQLALLMALLRLFDIEPGSGLLRILPVVFAGFVLHARVHRSPRHTGLSKRTAIRQAGPALQSYERCLFRERMGSFERRTRRCRRRLEYLRTINGLGADLPWRDTCGSDAASARHYCSSRPHTKGRRRGDRQASGGITSDRGHEGAIGGSAPADVPHRVAP